MMSPETGSEDLKNRLAEATELARRGDLDGAIVDLKAILDLNADHEIALGMLASIYLQIGLHAEAIERYDKLLDVNPENPLARFQLGMARLNAGEPEDALATWTPLLDADDEFMANFHSALALTQLGRNPEAVERLVVAGKHMPPSHPLYPQLVSLHARLTGETG